MAGQMPNFTNQGAMSIPGQIKSRELSWILSMLYFRDKIMLQEEGEANRINNFCNQMSDKQGQLLLLTKNSFIERWK